MGLFWDRKPLSQSTSQKSAALSPSAAPGKRVPQSQEDLLWERYLYEGHTRQQLASWAQRLKYFRFCRAYGGHANDGDQLLALLRIDDESCLLATCEALGIPLRPMPAGGEEMQLPLGERPSASRRFPDLQQPKHVEIAGARTFCYITSYMPKDANGALLGESVPALQLSVADPTNLWEVSESAVAGAAAIEQLLAPLSAQVIDPPQDDRNCLCPKHHPDLFPRRKVLSP